MTKALLLTISLVAISASGAFAQPAASNVSAKASPAQNAMTSPTTGSEWAMGIAAPGQLSMLTSQIALNKTKNPDIRDFAKFEVAEQQTVATIISEMGLTKPPVSPADQAVLDKLNAAQAGMEFDRAYLQAQIDGHTMLNTVTDAYLANSKAATETEIPSRHLAMLANATIDSHLETSQKLLARLK